MPKYIFLLLNSNRINKNVEMGILYVLDALLDKMKTVLDKSKKASCKKNIPQNI
jgi:hypothetical protein